MISFLHQFSMWRSNNSTISQGKVCKTLGFKNLMMVFSKCLRLKHTHTHTFFFGVHVGSSFRDSSNVIAKSYQVLRHCIVECVDERRIIPHCGHGSRRFATQTWGFEGSSLNPKPQCFVLSGTSPSPRDDDTTNSDQ